MNEDFDKDIPDEGFKGYDAGIEHEEEEEFTDPFDPEDISIDSKVIPMEACLRRLTQGTIIMNPDFQRKEVWTPDKRSQLIESLMLSIPLPMFYVSADEKNNYTVVDGLQRLSTIRRFVLGDAYLESVRKDKNKVGDEKLKGFGFPLENLEFWKQYNGMNFNQLPIHVRNRILETQFQFTVINPGTPEEVKRNIFKRLNTGGMPLSSQEIRNALYLGPSTKLLNELAAYPEFTAATDYSIKSLRMEDKELILRFLAFLIRNYTTYRKTIAIDSFLSDTMVIINAMPEFNSREFLKAQKQGNVSITDITALSIDDIKAKFKAGMVRTQAIFGMQAFRKSYGNNRRTSINKALFETWGNVMAALSEDEFSKLKKNKSAFLSDYPAVISDGLIQLGISRDSMKAPSVKLRFETFHKLVQKHTV